MPDSLAYYNDTDPHSCTWLSNLMAASRIMDGYVDSRSIADLKSTDFDGYHRVHLFAGIGGWDYALKLAGWPEDLLVWTGSCPCQPFSVAGKHKGVDDERHLWPEFKRLIDERRPAIIFGEQVASKDGREWLSGVQIDLEAMGYVVGAADLCAACVNAPHIRQRLYWVAYAERSARLWSERWSDTGFDARRGRTIMQDSSSAANAAGLSIGMADDDARLQGRRLQSRDEFSEFSPWSAGFDIIRCTDGKSRRVESGLQPLVDGLPFLLADGSTVKDASRAESLKGIGNSIVPQVAAIFIRSFMEVVGI